MCMCESWPKLPVYFMWSRRKVLRKHSKMNRGRPEAIGLIHLGEACEKILKNVEIGRNSLIQKPEEAKQVMWMPTDYMHSYCSEYFCYPGTIA